MSDILPPLTGPAVEKILGKRSVALVTDECVYGLKLVRVNDVPNCVHMVYLESEGCANVYPGSSVKEQLKLVKELEAECNMFPITMPMCTRTEGNAWETTARIFEALAAAARAQISTAKT